MLDFNDAQAQMGPLGELIPDGTFVKLQMKIRPGGADGPTPMDRGLLKAAAAPSDAKMLDCEFTVIGGPFDRRKLWQGFCVAGGKTDKNGVSMGWNISKSFFRAMIESATALDPKDMSDSAKAKRRIEALKQLDTIIFAARIMIEPATSKDYNDTNKIANVVLPGEPQYTQIMRGEPVEPEPVNAKPRKPREAVASQSPAWQQSANSQPAQQQGSGNGGQPSPNVGSGGENKPAWLNG